MLILAALVAVFLLIFVPWFFTGIATRRQFHYPDPNDGKTPISYKLAFRWINFASFDGIPLKGWYIPAEGVARGTIIYCHGLNRTRVEMLPDAVFGHSLGYNGLLFDLRHQGMSGGTITTVGYQERLDVEGAVHYALEQEHAARPVVVWGVSMGAAAALLAAAETPDVAAVISDSSFDSFMDTLRHHLKLFLHLPGFPIADEVGYWVAWRGHFKPGDFDLVKAAERIGDRPILFVAVEGDRRMPPSIAEKLYAHAQSPLKKIVVLPGHRHGEGFNQAREPYEKAVTDFLAGLSVAR
jgi:pimeloyl-ACP methyl ester carboxylesterase